jgi:hypothetical protein
VTRAEWAEICARVAGWWPQRQWPDSSAALYFDDLGDFDQADVLAAVGAVYREGREWPPNGGQVRARLVDLDQDLPGWPEVERQLNRLVGLGYGGPYHGFSQVADRCQAAREEMPVQVRTFVAKLGARELYATLQDPHNGPARLRMAWEQFGRKRRPGRGPRWPARRAGGGGTGQARTGPDRRGAPTRPPGTRRK